MGNKRSHADQKASDILYTVIEKENTERYELLKKIEPNDLIQYGMIPVISSLFFKILARY